MLAARLPHWSLWRALRSLVKPADPDAAYDALARFGLGDKLYARVDRLSGGERQRCGLARLLLSHAEVLLVDEPLSALDPTLSQLTLATLQQEAPRATPRWCAACTRWTWRAPISPASSACATAASCSTCRASRSPTR